MSTGSDSPGNWTTTAESRHLDSWKEIAAYLRRDVRTVQLWEKSEGLPIHRHMHKSRASVYAQIVELDAWWQDRNRRIAADFEPAVIEAATASIEGASIKDAPGGVPRSRSIRGYAAVSILVTVLLGMILLLAQQGLRRAIGNLVLWKPLSSVARLPLPVLAVLPFRNLSPEQESASASAAVALTEYLTTEMVRTGKLRVASHRSVARFKGDEASVVEVASVFHADLLLEGTVACTHRRMRVTAHLIDVRSDREIWSDIYVRTVEDADSPGKGRTESDVLSAQAEIASAVASAVVSRLADSGESFK
ncbi:MAG: hypothetical protein ACYCSN_09870 [Acidobacteriaceae bacterium]